MSTKGTGTKPKFIVVKIEPCPFCGDADCEVAESQVPNIHGGRKQAVFCHACFCEGPTADSQMDAIIAWNTRTANRSLLAALNWHLRHCGGSGLCICGGNETMPCGYCQTITPHRALIAAAEPKAEGKGGV